VIIGDGLEAVEKKNIFVPIGVAVMLIAISRQWRNFRPDDSILTR
jgi:hypothetical protein